MDVWEDKGIKEAWERHWEAYPAQIYTPISSS